MRATLTTTFILVTILLAAQNFPTQNMVLWLEAGSGTLNRDSLPAAPGDSIYWWLDKSGLGNHAKAEITSPGLGSPVLKADSLNGKPGVRFFYEANGNSWGTGMICQNHPSLNPAELTIFVVGSYGYDSRSYETFLMKTPDGGWNSGGYGISELNDMSGWVNSYSSYYIECGSRTKTPELFVMKFKKDTLGFKALDEGCDSVLSGTFGIDSIKHSQKGLLIGTGEIGYVLSGFIGELIIFNKYLSGNDYKSVETYLKNKYKLSSDGTTTSMNQPESIAPEILIYPIPANNEVNISFPEKIISEQKQVLIYDLNGKKIIEQQMNIGDSSTQISTSNLLNGIYLLKISCPSQNSLSRLIIQR